MEDLLSRISVIEELKVISRTSSEMYRQRGAKSIPEIASELGVSYILDGSVQRYGDKARIMVQLIDAINDKIITYLDDEINPDELINFFKKDGIVKQIVERHGGKIWVNSQKDIGTKFSFTLPKTDYLQTK